MPCDEQLAEKCKKYPNKTERNYLVYAQTGRKPRPKRTTVPRRVRAGRLARHDLLDVLTRTEGGCDMSRVRRVAHHLVERPVKAATQKVLGPTLEVAQEQRFGAALQCSRFRSGTDCHKKSLEMSVESNIVRERYTWSG